MFFRIKKSLAHFLNQLASIMTSFDYAYFIAGMTQAIFTLCAVIPMECVAYNKRPAANSHNLKHTSCIPLLLFINGVIQFCMGLWMVRLSFDYSDNFVLESMGICQLASYCIIILSLNGVSNKQLYDNNIKLIRAVMVYFIEISYVNLYLIQTYKIIHIIIKYLVGYSIG